jgi:hypothetical protein
MVKFAGKGQSVFQDNAVFLVSLETNRLDSLYADENGTWNTCKPRSYLRVGKDEDGEIVIEAGSKDEHDYVLFRQYGKHKASLKQGVVFERLIATLVSSRGISENYALVSYMIKNGKSEDVVVAKHGNAARTNRPYFGPTDPKTLEEIKSKVTDTRRPLKAYHELMMKESTTGDSTSPATQPRNLKQVQNAKHHAKKDTVDEVTKVIFDIRHSQRDFARELKVGKSGLEYVICSDYQLQDTIRCYTNPLDFSVLSIDGTFNLADYYLTSTSYQHPLLVHAGGRYVGKHPYIIGPMLVHNRRETEDYCYLWSTLQNLNTEFKYVQAVGSDGEEAIMNSVAMMFPDALKLLCRDHKRQNLDHALRNNFGAESMVRKHVLEDVFGTRRGQIQEEGLIDAMSDEEFDVKFFNLRSSWEHLVPGFYAWFQRFECDLFKMNLIKGVTSLAGKDTFSNNAIESLQKKIKDCISREKHNLAELNKQMHDLVKIQKQEMESAVYGHGNYDISEEFSHLRVNRSKWNWMTQPEKDAALKRFWAEKPQSLTEPTEKPQCCDANRSAAAATATAVPTGTCGDLELLEVTDDTIPGIAGSALLNLKNKSLEVIREPGNIVNAPGVANGKFVKSSSGKPHFVQTYKTGKVSCDCEGWSSIRFCSHSLAVSAVSEGCHKFVQWRKKEHVTLTNVATGGTAVGGRKSGPVQKRRRGGRTPLDLDPPKAANLCYKTNYRETKYLTQSMILGKMGPIVPSSWFFCS